ncbi:hypothetical protein RDI58_022463 [Solanum bulbocastanum]|uniref:DUF4283 domain-containing protein n=1 Tax=Solanum bulbocastanum TaxID=147425 RepID=A0AAN8Y5N7_SOLBU
MLGVMHSGTTGNSLEHIGETKQPDLEETVVEIPNNIIFSLRSTQGIAATVANGTAKKDMQEIFYNGPYTINNKPIILKPWSIDFDLSKEFPTEIPLWVKFPNIPMTYWSKDFLSRIASAVGKPVYADECTTKQTRISFARMLIELMCLTLY